MYKEYLENPLLPITAELADEILTEMRNSAAADPDEDARDIYKDFVKAAHDYVQIRIRWNTLTNDQKMNEDPGRTATHNLLLYSYVMLHRVLEHDGIPHSWYKKLPYDASSESGPVMRKTVGDLACYLVLFGAILAR